MKAAVIAFLAAARARILAYFVANWLPFALRYGVPLAILVLLAIGWHGGTAWTRTLMVLSASFASIIGLDIAGYLPGFKPTKS